MLPHQPLLLRQLSSAQAQLRHVLLQHRPQLEIATAQGAISVGLVPDQETETSDLGQTSNTPSDSGQSLMLAVGAARMHLSLDATTLAAIAGAWSDAPTADALPAPLWSALTTARFAPVLEALNASFGMDARIISTDAPPPAPDDWTAIELVPLNPTPAPRCGRLHCDAEVTRALIDAVKQTPTPPQPRTIDWSRLSVDLTLELCRAPFTAAELAGLGPDDILLLPSDAPIAAQQLVLRQGTRSLASARLDHNSLTILRLAETSMTDDDNGDSLDQQPLGLDTSQPSHGGALNPADIEIRLDFDLGHLSLSLAELQRLQPGAVLELDTAAGRPVRIRSGRQLLGYGELVQIDDRLGVIIRRLQVGDEPSTA